MTDNLLGRGWNPFLLLWWCAHGRTSAASARRTRSPSTVPIRTNEFVIADRRMFSWLDGDPLARPAPAAGALWRLQRKEPGWVVGEHMQVRRRDAGAGEIFLLAMARPGEVGRVASMEKRTEGAETPPPVPTRWTRVGDADLWWKKEGVVVAVVVVDRAAKEEDAKPVAAEEEEESGVARWKALEMGSTGPLRDLVLLDDIVGWIDF